MTILHYIDCCKAFAASGETAKAYVLAKETYEGGYIQSGDCGELANDDGSIGPDISWAAGCTPEEIEQWAPQQFVDSLLEEIQLAIDDGWDMEGFQSIHRRFSDTGFQAASDYVAKKRAEEKALCRELAEYEASQEPDGPDSREWF